MMLSKLEALFEEIVREAKENPEFASRLEESLQPKVAPRRRGGRRPPGVLDPFAVHAEGEGRLRARLAALEIDQLKDIVAEHGMDKARLALKWRTPDRLIDLIVSTVQARLEKGDAFRADG